MKLYLDTSALNRIFDDRSQVRIALEALAMQSILLLIQDQKVQLITSDALSYEVSRNPYAERKAVIMGILQLASVHQPFTNDILIRAQQLEKIDKIGKLDAFHIACAEYQVADVFITCDDRLIKRYQGSLQLCNPVNFTLERTKPEES
ncbi:MAG: PIN domain-containing protein [Cyanobacteria bacterium]|nr:PIN domain-containing protein [Cyanobacteriota bacterium]MDW8202996.1 PIN domain-containing protein [Cyanobacteriota bacterium SKYGB_h_bin112]